MISFDERYKIQSKLGEGASAVVYLATDALTKKTVAIKIAHDVLTKHARFTGRWQREVILLTSLQHPRVVPLLDAQLQGGRLAMVMAYAKDNSLEFQLSNGCTVSQALKWLIQVLEGLAHVHSFGVIHQDIKPENILVNDDGNVWLADFSVARTRAELLTNRQDVTGTPEWYSPEQRLRLASEIGPWSDLYSWGKMLERLIASISYRSGELSQIVDGCIYVDPQQRFRSAGEIVPLMKEI